MEPLSDVTPVDLYRVIDVEIGRPWTFALVSQIHSETVYSHSTRALVAHILGPEYADLPVDTGVFEHMYALPARFEAMNCAADAAAAELQRNNPDRLNSLSHEELVTLLTPAGYERDAFISHSDLIEWTSDLPLMCVLSQWHWPKVLPGATVLDVSSDKTFLRSLEAIRLIKFIALSETAPPF